MASVKFLQGWIFDAWHGKLTSPFGIGRTHQRCEVQQEGSPDEGAAGHKAARSEGARLADEELKARIKEGH